jgi:hypothetical protein
MPGCVADRIGFGLNDASAQPSVLSVMNDDLANQKARQGHGVNGKVRTPQASKVVTRIGSRHQS